MNSGSDKGQGLKTLTEQLQHELGVHADTAIGKEILLYLDRLIKDEDEGLNWVDLMVLRLTRAGVPLPTTIQCLAARVAERRLRAVKSSDLPTAVMRDHAGLLAHPIAAFLAGALGIGIEAAYDAAANSIGAEIGYAGTASVVGKGRKKYAEDFGVADLLTEIGSIWAQENPEQQSALREYHASVPQRDPGTRRGRRDTDDAN